MISLKRKMSKEKREKNNKVSVTTRASENLHSTQVFKKQKIKSLRVLGRYIQLMLELQPRAQHIGHCGFVQICTFTTTAAPDQFK